MSEAANYQQLFNTVYSNESKNSAKETLFAQYERAVIQSIITSFGLDFLVKDRHGGDVDTIHNVRQIGIDAHMAYKNERNAVNYNNRGEYDPKAYHNHPTFTSIKREARERFNNDGEMITDGYTGTQMAYAKASSVSPNIRAELDHIVECKQIHDDRGRVLAGADGVELANKFDNLVFTNKSLNASMGSWAQKKNAQWRKEHGCDAPIDVLDMNAYLNEHPDIPKDQAQNMRNNYNKARSSYEKDIAFKYYGGAIFLKDTASAVANTSVRMGIRQALGLVFTEIWLSVRESIRLRHENSISLFSAIGLGFKEGLANACDKYKEIWNEFIKGSLSGALSSIITTICNAFFTTTKTIGRIIRQSFSSLVDAVKILLSCDVPLSQRITEASKVISVCAGVVIGSIVSEAVASSGIATIPVVGGIIPEFLGCLVGGIISCTLLYVIDYDGDIVKQAVKSLGLNTVAVQKEQYEIIGEQIDNYARNIDEINLYQTHLRAKAYKSAVDEICTAKDQKSLSTALDKAKKDLNIKNCYGKHDNFDSFMNDDDASFEFH